MSNKEDLPSINEYLEDSNLPSYKDFIEEICDPTIPLKKTVIILAVNPNTWLMVNKLRFLFIKKYIYLRDKG